MHSTLANGPGEVARIIAATDEARGLVEHHIPEVDRTKRLAELDRPPRAAGGQGRASSDVPDGERWGLRADLIRVDKALGKLEKEHGKELSTAKTGGGWPTLGRGSARPSITPPTGS